MNQVCRLAFAYPVASAEKLNQAQQNNKNILVTKYTGTTTKQESCAIAKMTVQCADKSKQTATPSPKIT